MAKGIDYEIYLILRVHEDKNSKKKPIPVKEVKL